MTTVKMGDGGFTRVGGADYIHPEDDYDSGADKSFEPAHVFKEKPDLHTLDMQKPEPVNTQDMIRTICAELADFLCEKNKAYGNSAIEPVRIFAKSGPLEQINVRLDDKLNRLLQGEGYPGDDDEKDLVGYFILKWVCKRVGRQAVQNMHIRGENGK